MNGLHCAFTLRLTADPVARYGQDGTAMLRLSGRVQDAKASPDAEPEWIAVAVWGERALELRDVLKKGDEVYCEGRCRLKTWTDREQRERSSLEVSAWTVQPLGLIGKNAPAYRAKVAQSEREHGERTAADRAAGAYVGPS